MTSLARLPAAVVLTAVTLAGCDLVAPNLGETSLTVTAETGPGAAVSIGGTTVEATLVAFAVPAATWRVDGSSRPVPPGRYTLEVRTMHHSDDIGCEVDPTASGGMRCHQDSHSLALCRAEIHVAAGSEVAYRYVRDGEDRCTLEAS